MAAFFAREENIDISEMEEILKMTEEEINNLNLQNDE